MCVKFHMILLSVHAFIVSLMSNKKEIRNPSQLADWGGGVSPGKEG